ncbi:MAG: arginine--tRNA ligase [Bacteroidetes bacterium HGW-Bacteroidetes-17]|jgi:arginyl-tRNA synthetase|nr:MAG: arginine--tRNA ligase [Bacteroidetes bacterium HGW-Bacteroidetes-17]
MIEQILTNCISKACLELFGTQPEDQQIQIQKTKREFEGDLTLVVFPLVKMSRKSPADTAKMLGEHLQNELTEIVRFNVVQGFLNLVVADAYWVDFLKTYANDQQFGKLKSKNQAPVVIEFSSPNTNKPLHLGHVRNNLLGHSVAAIVEAAGYEVKRVNLVNDRGIHICKSMLAWQKWGHEITPEKAGKKGDKLVGDFYVLFDQKNKIEIQKLMETGVEAKAAEKESPLMIEAQQMLQKWEQGDEEIRSLWKRMNDWVYSGFDKTYARMGIRFDKTYYESETYLLGKSLVEEGLTKGVLIKKEDGSVWADLSDSGLDEKLLLRADGTSVYMTQDLGTAKLRYDDYRAGKLIYVVGNEQNYHFDVLKIVLKKIGFDWADRIKHLSYGMVELPEGKMKSREGTVVDADELMEEMFQTAKNLTSELGKVSDFTIEESAELFEMVGLGALKYFILKVDPKKNMMFNPEESVDFTGNTGPFIQYTHARISSLLRKANEQGITFDEIVDFGFELHPKEIRILHQLHEYPSTIALAAENLSPAMLSNYIYDLVREYNQFYQEVPIFKETDRNKMVFRLQLSKFTAQVIKSGMELLGIQVPDRM